MIRSEKKKQSSKNRIHCWSFSDSAAARLSLPTGNNLQLLSLLHPALRLCCYTCHSRWRLSDELWAINPGTVWQRCQCKLLEQPTYSHPLFSKTQWTKTPEDAAGQSSSASVGTLYSILQKNRTRSPVLFGFHNPALKTDNREMSPEMELLLLL